MENETPISEHAFHQEKCIPKAKQSTKTQKNVKKTDTDFFLYAADSCKITLTIIKKWVATEWDSVERY